MEMDSEKSSAAVEDIQNVCPGDGFDEIFKNKNKSQNQDKSKIWRKKINR